MTDAIHLPEMVSEIAALRTVYFVRWMRKAQKQALIEWRDRKQTPGVAARFEVSAYKDYGFADRNPFYWRKREKAGQGNFRPYYLSGAFYGQLKARRPTAVTKNAKSEVRTRFKYGGGVLNLLQNKFGTIDSYRERRSVSVFIRPYEYKHRRTGTLVRVNGYQTNRTRTSYVFIHSSRSFADDWGYRFNTVDKPWLERRTAELFIEGFRKSATTKKGGFRLKYFGEDD